MTWWQGRMLALDLETTHRLPESARIVQYGVVWVGGGEPPVRHSGLVNPGVPIPAEATEIHGITDEMVRDAPTEFEAVEFLFQNVISAAAQRIPIVGANVGRYDLTVLDRAARRYGTPEVELAETWDRVRVVDVFLIDKLLDRYRRSYPRAPYGMSAEDAQAAGHVSTRTLAGMCEHFGVRLEQAHDASADALASARLAYHFARHGEVIRKRPDSEGHEAREMWADARDDLDALHALQGVVAAADRQRFLDYKRRQLMDVTEDERFANQDAADEVRELIARLELERGWPVLEVMPHEHPEWHEDRTTGTVA